MKAPVKKAALTVLKFGVPIAIVWFLVSKIDDDQWATLQTSEKNYWFLGCALLIGIGATLISYIRWCLLVKSHQIELSYIEGIRLGAIGFLLNFVSVGAVGGDVFKAFFLAHRSPGKRIEAFATVLVDRVIGLYGLLVVSSCALLAIGDALTGNDAIFIRSFIYGSTIVGAAGMIGIVIGGKLIDKLLDAAGRLPYVGPFVHRIADPFRAFRDHTGVFMLTILMAVVGHILLGIAIFFIASGLYPTHPSLTEHMVIVPVTNAIAGLPISLAGIGVFEGVLEALYQSIPPEPTSASGIVVGLVYELVKLFIAAVGIVFYWTAGSDVQASFKAATDESGDSDESETSVTDGDETPGT